MSFKVDDFSVDLSVLNRAQLLSLRDISADHIKKCKQEVKESEEFYDSVIKALKVVEEKATTLYTINGKLEIIEG
ncbi:hypothetical protein [Escherichia phage vB_EcoM-LTH01]